MVDITQDHNNDNKLEDYFFDLLISKHATDKEIMDLLHVIQKSKIHKDYKLKLSHLLFWEENLYVQNWWTLQQSLLSIAHNECLRTWKIHTHGVVLELLFKMVEYLFDIPDSHMLNFIMSDDKESVEHSIIALMKRVLDYFEIGFEKLLSETSALAESIQDTGWIPSEYILIEKALLQYPEEILKTQSAKIHELKNQIDTIGLKCKKNEISL